MKSKLSITLSVIVWALMLMAAYVVSAHAQTNRTTNQQATTKVRATQISGITPGSGTIGLLARLVSDGSLVVQAKVTGNRLGNLGITCAGSKLTVKEMIATTLGGRKFPNGTLQLASAAKTPLFIVVHDDSLQGDGTSSSPLGIKVPLTLNGSLTVGGVIRATPSNGIGVEATGGIGEFGVGANGVNASGGTNPGNNGGIGVLARGGASDSQIGGAGVVAEGGTSDSASGGTGLQGDGGNSQSGRGGIGVLAIGGRSKTFKGGTGVLVLGGSSENSDGGIGIEVAGGDANVAGVTAGTGIVARAGTARFGAGKGLAGRFDGDVLVANGNLEVFRADLKIFNGKLEVEGDVSITGNLAKGSGSFKIDHPLDPENKYLSHSFVESPDMMNIYNGTVRTNANGKATVTLPDWFEALNKDFRYQLTVIGTFAQAIVAEEIKGNRFIIKTNAPNVKVSWQVTGIRHDAYANKHRIVVEEQKPEQERGLFLHPDAFNQAEAKGVQFVKKTPQTARINATRQRAGNRLNKVKGGAR